MKSGPGCLGCCWEVSRVVGPGGLRTASLAVPVVLAGEALAKAVG